MKADVPIDPTRLEPFSVGDWLVEPKACRLLKGDSIVKLRPQLMDLLVCLARRAGDIVLRDEILAEVWPGQFIAESGLSRCVAELRQSLQDDAQHPRYVETIPKRGYRLVAPVAPVARAPHTAAPDLEATPSTPDTAAAVVEPERPAERAEPDAPRGAAGEPALGPVPDPAPLPAGARGLGWRPGVWMTLAVALIVAVVAAILALTRAPVNALTERDTVLLADVRNSTGDRVFDDSLRLAAAVNLGQAPFLRILPAEVMRDAVARTGRPRDERVAGPLALDVCRREGAAIVLVPSIAPLGSRYAVGIETVACATGEEIGRALEVARSKEGVLDALDGAVTRIRRTLGEERASLQRHNVALVRATTSSLDALQALTLGDYYRDHARPAEAFSMYRQATELDPDFALGWARRGSAAINLNLADEVIPALRRAYELRDRTTAPERFYITAGYHRIVEADPDKTIEVYQTWKQMYPGSAVPVTNLASTLTSWMGQFDAALPEAQEAVRLAPYSSLASVNLVVACLGAGRIAEARTALQEAVARGQDDLITHQHLTLLAMLDGDRVALERETRWASTRPQAALWLLRARAGGAMAAGQLREARRLWSDAAVMAGEIGSASLEGEVRLDLAEAEALLGDARAARQSVEAGLALDGGAHPRVISALVLDLIGDRARAKALLDAVQQPSNPVTDRVWLPVARALNAAGRDSPGDALSILQPVVRFERGHAFALAPLGVHAIILRLAGRPADAAKAFNDLIGLHAVHAVSRWVPFARISRARALREADRAGSAAAYDAFLDAWKHADPDAPLFVAAKQERAALGAR